MKKTLFLITILIIIVCIVGCVASNEKPGSASASTTAGATSTALTQITTGDVTSAFVTEEILPPPTDSIEEGISWPEGQAIPWFATPEKTLDVIMRGQIADDERLTVLSLQGIVNKTKPRLLIPEDNAEEGSLTWANTLGCILRRTSDSKVMEVIKKYSSEASGVVLYSAARSPHYANLAATVAGTMDALPMTMTVYSRWKAAGIDLPVLAAVASAYKNVPLDRDTVLLGEVGLTGELRAINGVKQRIDECVKLGFKKIILPKGNKRSLNDEGKIKLLFADNVFTALSLAAINEK